MFTGDRDFEEWEEMEEDQPARALKRRKKVPPPEQVHLDRRREKDRLHCRRKPRGEGEEFGEL